MISHSYKKLGSTIVALGSVMCSVVYAQTVEAIIDSGANLSISSTSGQQILHTESQISVGSSRPPYSGCVEQLYKISGYYSPKPNQKVTTRDTYEQEIRLNGRGINGASGMPVFNGMIAAPKSYSFGTIIVLPGLGTGQVQDRGSAIVNSDGYDRIDLWVGEGDDGIHRAKSIGLRWIVGWYCPGSVTKQIGFDWKVIPQYADFVSVAFWSIDQNIGRSGPLVTKAQSYLRSLGYLTTDTLPGIYDQQMRQLVCRFQIDHLGLNGNEDYCGVLGPQTRNVLKRMLVKKGLVSDESIYQLTNQSSVSPIFTAPNVRPARNYQVNTGSVSSSTATTTATGELNLKATRAIFTDSVKFGEESDRIVVLQKILAREGLFDHTITGYFGPITRSALIQLQLKYKLIDSIDHPAAGYIGPATRTLLNKKQLQLTK